MDRYDVAVVGGSFAGLAAAMMLGRTRRRVLLVDSGRPRNRFTPGSHGFLGQDGRPPAEILATFREQVLAYPSVERWEDEAVDAHRDADGRLALTLASGQEASADRLILATGIVDELPEVPGLAERWGVTVLHCPYCHGYEVADRRLGVLATGEGALHQAPLLTDWSDEVILFSNGVLVPDADQRAMLEGRGIRIVEGEVSGIEGTAPEITAVRLRSGDRVPVDALFTATRTHLASPLAERLGCAIDEGGFGPVVRTDAWRQTTVPGVFCAGDASRAPHNATWAASDGVTAAIAAHRSLVFPSA